jgi:putative ABC transport system permease protein
LLRRLIRKMLSNKAMISCLLLGLILAVAMISSIPIYSEGVMQRMLTKDLEDYQNTTHNYPGGYYIQFKFYNLEKSEALEHIKRIDQSITKQLYPEVGLPAVAYNYRMTNDFLSVMPAEEQDEKKKKGLKIEALQEMKEHIKILHGRMPSDKVQGDVYEVIVTESAVQHLDLILDKIYLAKDIINDNSSTMKIKVVGVFNIKDPKDPYWKNENLGMEESFIMDFSLFNSDYIKNESASISNVQWYYALDYHKIKVKNLNYLVSVLQSHSKLIGNGYNDVMPSISILKKYEERAKVLKTTLWVIQIPVLLMISFYLFMVSQLIVEKDKNEIAVLISRGANRGQIIRDYFFQGGILCLIALITGPPIGLIMCRIIGAASGFLQFVNRTRLPLSMNTTAYLYSIASTILFIVTMLLPVVSATRTSIVLHKQKKARKTLKTFWKRYYIDVLLLIISLYGLYSYRTRQDILKITGVKGNEIPIDPLLFLISSLFIISLGMIFLRIFPYIVALIYKLGRKFWSPTVYSSLINASRSDGKDGFIILFLILTISIGLFNANAARTINSNVEEKVRYSVGADITIKTKWENDAPVPGMDPSGEAEPLIKKPITYVEPPFQLYTQIDGVESAAKVFRKKDAIVQIGNKSYGDVYVMGIDTQEFGETAWFRNSLLSHHINDYLNVLAKAPTAFIVSTSFKEKYKSKLGDSIYVKWGENNYIEGTIYGFVDYWPTYNPHEKAIGGKGKDLVVGNLGYFQAKTRLEPYEIWLKSKAGATSRQIYEDIQEKKLEVLDMDDAKQTIITRKNDPMLQGTNGVLTMGFIITMIICTIGFLIYWILSIQGRTLQFGVLRAMGMTFKNILGVILCDQVIISGTAIIVGIISGGLTSELFIPLLQIVYSSSDQVPPFKVAAYGGDYIKLYIIILLMLLLGIAVLGRLISRISVNGAIKLGED